MPAPDRGKVSLGLGVVPVHVGNHLRHHSMDRDDTCLTIPLPQQRQHHSSGGDKRRCDE